MPSIEALPLSIVDIDTWHFLAKIANELMRWQDTNMLAKIENGGGDRKFIFAAHKGGASRTRNSKTRAVAGVMEELMELQHGEITNTRAEAATAGARQAMVWLREQTRQKCPRMFTLTMRGRRVPIAVVREESADDREMVNDDRILRSCVNFTQLEPAQESTFSDFKKPQGRDTPIIYRNVILLTDDRVLNMKAMSEHIPCRTMMRFMKWAKIS
ncbi:hypothetical protein ANCCEY_05686 [Ancylostoma ceylanicum]|uniref:PIN domain-containing protein n=1 Tax=Ancylostoma ceylanicum TaxID=53326 RepID=A0A0D6LT15_9BILA|nr:hypothetical protein ANCCEY_05686 [Ancylostoma ceylanicum]